MSGSIILQFYEYQLCMTIHLYRYDLINLQLSLIIYHLYICFIYNFISPIIMNNYDIRYRTYNIYKQCYQHTNITVHPE